MKLNYQELSALRDMIAQTSLKRLNTIKASKDMGTILFLGDSMIEYLDVKNYLSTLDIVNRGVAGATTKFTMEHLDELTLNIDPKEIFISIGSNDLVLLEASPKSAVDNIKKLLMELQNRFVLSTIYYLSATPVVKEGHRLYKKIYIGGRTNEEQCYINQKIKEFTDSHQMIFVNVYDILKDSDGYLKESYTADGIHLNKLGYEFYAQIIQNELRKNHLCST